LEIGDTVSLDPDVAHEVTLGADGDSDFIVGTEHTDVIHAFGLHGEVCVTLVILAEEAHLGITGNVDILGTHRHELD